MLFAVVKTQEPSAVVGELDLKDDVNSNDLSCSCSFITERVKNNDNFHLDNDDAFVGLPLQKKLTF